MRECWAKALGGCSGGLTREHVFTRGLFDKKFVKAFGLGFLKQQNAEISIDAVTVKALCASHNSGFSELDDAVIEFWCALREFGRLSQARRDADSGQRKSTRWPRAEFQLDGLRLERWCMKTTINMWLSNHPDLGGWSPSAEIVEIIGGRRLLPNGVGLAVLDVQQMPSSEAQLVGSISFSTLRNLRNDEIGAGLFHFAGLMLLCSWETPVSSLLPVHSKGLIADGQWHAKGIRDENCNVEVCFDWTGKRAGHSVRELLRNRSPLPR